MSNLQSVGTNVIFEADVLVWHSETISIGNNVYVGHRTMLKSYHKGSLAIANDVWIGQNVFIHAAGHIIIQSAVGIGPGVSILTSYHNYRAPVDAILDAPLEFGAVTIEAGVDIGTQAIILPGVTIGQGAQIGAGSVVTKSVEPWSVVAGNPAKSLGSRRPVR